MAARKTPKNHGYKVLAVAIATLLWGIAQGQKDVQSGFDIPVEFEGVPESLVITDQSSDVVNIRVQGSRAALRNVSPGDVQYVVDVSGAKRGEADFEVDLSDVEQKLPRGANIVSRSPSSLKLTFEPRSTRSVRVKADLEGEPAQGATFVGVDIDPARVRITGARSEVLRLSEVMTETVDITGLARSEEREARLALGGGHVWVEDPKPLLLRINIDPPPVPTVEAEGESPG